MLPPLPRPQHLSLHVRKLQRQPPPVRRQPVSFVQIAPLLRLGYELRTANEAGDQIITALSQFGKWITATHHTRMDATPRTLYIAAVHVA